MHTLTVALLPGDGIGPEVVAEGARVLRAVAERGGHAIEMREGLIGGCAIDARALSKLPQELGSFAWQAEHSDAQIAAAVRDGVEGSAMPPKPRDYAGCRRSPPHHHQCACPQGTGQPPRGALQVDPC